MMDLRYALRTLRKSPGFTTTAVLTLALGIGASAAIFTLLDQVSLRQLPVKDPNQLVLLDWDGDWNGSNTGGYAAWSYPWYEDLTEQTGEIFEDLIGRAGMGMAVGVAGEAEQAEVVLVTGNYFRTLGIGATVGRVLQDGDNEIPDAHPVAVLTYEYWQNRFGGDRDVVGTTILLNQHPFEVVGVSQKDFRGIDLATRPKVFIPAMMKNSVSVGFQKQIYQLDNRRSRWMNVFGRLAEGVSREQAQAAIGPVMQAGLEYDLATDLAGMDDRGKESYRQARLLVEPGGRGRTRVRDALESPLRMLMIMVALLLLIACGNVANLLMARAAGRTKEVAVRFAIGATRARVVRQLLAECALISAAAAALGLLAASWAADFILRFAPDGAESFNFTTDADWRILAFAVVAAAGTTFLFGLLPALRTTQLHLAPALKDQAGSIAGGNDSWRRALASSQVFFSLLLLIGAALFSRSLMELQNIDPGFETEQTLVFAIDPMQGGYDDEATRLWLARLEERLEARPEVVSAGFSATRLLDDDTWSNSVKVEGYESAPEEAMIPNYNAISPGYLRTLEIPLLEGRAFTEADATGAARVGIVNESFVKHFFPNESPLGRHFSFYVGPEQYEIVGVIPDTRYEGVKEEIPEQVFVPFAQAPWPTGAHIYIRSDRDPAVAVPAARAVSRELDASLPVVDLLLMEDQKNTTLSMERMLAFLATAFGVLATLLAAVGLYGLLAYSVSRRKREIGLRIALGAQSGDISWLVLREVVWLFVIGAAAAIPVAMVLGRFMESQLYGVKPTDPLSMAGAVAVLSVVALAAGYLPARRAARTQPMEALRLE
jgi:predicted permease